MRTGSPVLGTRTRRQHDMGGEGGSMRETSAWTLGDYLAVLRRRAWIVVGATVITAAALPRPVTTSFSEGEAGD